MQIVHRIIFAVLFVLMLTAPVLAEEQFKNLVRPTLLVSHTEAAPGSRIAIGVLYQVKPQWHIYWRYPGDAGLATQLDISSEALAPASALYWPIPRTFTQPGDIVGYGYEGQVLLWKEFDVPNDAAAQSSIAATISTSWLACADLCVPDKATLQGSVKVGVDKASPHLKVFEEWRTKLPVQVAVGDSNAPLQVQVQGGLDRPSQQGQFELAFTARAGKVNEVAVARERILRITDYTSTAHGDALEVRFNAEVTKGKTLQSTELPVLVRVGNQDGTIGNYELLLPIYK